MNTVFFDLDGTLLPLNQEEFVKSYFSLVAGVFAKEPYSYDPQALVKGIAKGTAAMVSNDGSVSNMERFWQVFAENVDKNIRKYEKDFDAFYSNEFLKLRNITKQNKYTLECVNILKDKGYTLVAATNPLFPKAATAQRLSWAGVSYDDFEYVTTYDNCSYCKPSLDYYRGILKNIGKKPQDCLMVGNDVIEDMCTEKIGFNTYLVTDCLINPEKADISRYNNGSFEDFYRYVNDLPRVEMLKND